MAEALALPESSRAEVAARLLASLESPIDSLSDEALVEEAQKRSEQMDNDPSCVVTHEQFMAEFRDRSK